MTRALRFFLWIRERLQERRIVDGVAILALETRTIDRVVGALALIKRCDPRRYRRLTADVKRIWVERSTGSSGWFDRHTWTIWLNESDVIDADTGIEKIASTIVHEATHARLFRAGVGYDEPIRFRVERACIRRERAFAANVPGGIDGIWQEEQLGQLPDYSDKAFELREEATQLADLRMLNVPRWVIATAMWMRQRRKAART